MPYVRKKRVGRPRTRPYRPDGPARVTQETQAIVYEMARHGMQDNHMATCMGLTERDFRHKFAPQTAAGRAAGCDELSRTAWMVATGGGDWKKANISMLIFLCKVRLRMKEPPQQHEIFGSIGIHNLDRLSDGELSALEGIMSKIQAPQIIDARVEPAKDQ